MRSKIIFTAKKGAKFHLESEAPQNGWYYASVLQGNVKGWLVESTVSIQKAAGPIAKITPTPTPWQYITSTPLADYYYNPTTSRRYGDMAEMWTKVIPLNKQAWIEDLYRNVLNAPVPPNYQFDTYSHALDKYLANCRTQKMARIRQILYTLTGEMGGFDMSDREITLYDVVPDSIGASLWATACAVKPS